MSWNTKLTKLLSIDYPIIQGAMAYISDGVLAAAMNHAGCAGVIGSGGFSADEVRDSIRTAKDILGNGKCYGVNLMLQAPNVDDVAQVICDEKVPFVTIGAGNPLHGLNLFIMQASNAFRLFQMQSLPSVCRMPELMPSSSKAWKQADMTVK